MGSLEDPFEQVEADAFAEPASLLRTGTTSLSDALAPAAASFATARLHGFDLDDRPLVSALADLPGEIVTARTTVRLTQAMVGAGVVLVYEGGDPNRPIILGVLQDTVRAAPPQPAVLPERPTVEADGERTVISAEREILLRCGDASITLTRAGKVILKGNYILSRSTGYNKIKGAAVDIN